MAELKDYSCSFKPTAKYEDFSKDVLVKLLKEYQRAYLIILGEWDKVTRERFLLAIFETRWRQKWAPVRLHVNPWRYKMDKEWAQAIKKLSL